MLSRLGIAAARTSSTTSGLLAITNSSSRAAASGCRLACSHSRIVAGEKPNRRTNAVWLRPNPARIARTSTLAGAGSNRLGGVLPVEHLHVLAQGGD